MIKQLSQQTAEDLCAQQVITSLPDCIKELIDNSIDAKSTFIKILLHEYGKTKIEVIDNGMGIDSFDFLGKKGSTSKNKLTDKFDYLGFRGEAIHSIGKVSGAMEIESKCSKDGYRRKFNIVTLNLQQFKEERVCSGDFNFVLPNRQGSKNTGTKVTIERIFQRLPVRYVQLQSKYKQFLRRTHEMIKEFCLIYPEIQFLFINCREGKEEALIETASHKRFDRGGWLDRIKELDEKIGNSLIYISSSLFQGYVLNKIESGSSRENAFIKKNYHYLFANRRPIDILPGILALLNQLYKKYNNSTKYAFIINLKLEHQQIDVNLSPNKREIFVRKAVLEQICENLRKEITQKVIEEIPSLSSYQEKIDKKGRGSIGSSQLQNYSRPSNTQIQPSLFPSQTASEVILPEPRKDGRNPRKSIYFPVKPAITSPQQNVNANKQTNSPFSKAASSHLPSQTALENKEAKSSKSSFSEDLNLPKIVVDRNKIKEQLNSKLGVSFSGLKRTTEAFTKPSETVSKASLETMGDDGKRVNQRELEDIKKRNQESKLRQEQQDAKKRAAFLQELKEVKLQEAAGSAGSAVVMPPKPPIPQFHYPEDGHASKSGSRKENLMEEEIRLRQSNEGEEESEEEGLKEEQGAEGIAQSHNSELAMRIKSKLKVDMSQIFQNFQNKKMGRTPQSTQQPSAPIPADPSLQNQTTVREQPKMDEELSRQLGELAPKSLQKNQFQNFSILGQFNLGFIIAQHRQTFYMVDQHAADEKYQYQKNLAKSKQPDCINCFEEREVTPIEIDEIQEAKYLLQEAGFYYKIVERTLRLERCPIFFGRKLGMEYLNEIVAEKRELQRLNKFNAMCASMACRSAVKVGEPLTKEQMRRQVANLSTLKSPWNCPHGRPTLIQLGSILTFKEGIKLKKEYVL